MTDLYEALRAATTPDGRVRLTRELLTAMHEEGERRGRGESVEVWRERAFAAEGALTVRLAVRREIEEALGMVPGLTDDQALQRGLDAVRTLRERAEKAERDVNELEAETETGEVVEAERDQLAAALAEVRDAASESIRESFWVGNDAPARAARERVIAVLAALPTDLAAQREARIRADERAKALREAADRLVRDYRASHRADVVPWLRAMADEAERGGA